MKHKLVIERIEEISGKNKEITEEKQNKTSFFSLFWYGFSSKNEVLGEKEENKKLQPFISVSRLREDLKKLGEKNFLALEAESNLIEILLDLHKLGKKIN